LEPMHPHGLNVLMLGALVLLVSLGPTRRVTLTGAAAGGGADRRDHAHKDQCGAPLSEA